MTGASIRQHEERLLRDSQGVFSSADLEGVPGPVASYLRAAVAEGTPLALSARMDSCGPRERLGWSPDRIGSSTATAR